MKKKSDSLMTALDEILEEYQVNVDYIVQSTNISKKEFLDLINRVSIPDIIQLKTILGLLGLRLGKLFWRAYELEQSEPWKTNWKRLAIIDDSSYGDGDDDNADIPDPNFPLDFYKELDLVR